MKRLVASLVFAFAVSGCSAIETAATKLSQDEEVVHVNSFNQVPRLRPVFRSNVDIATEFLEFSFQLETGQTIAKLSRFEGPITVAFNTPAPVVLQRDLAKLVKRLRIEAGLDIRVGRAGAPAQIYINRISARQLRATLPGAACFVTPNVRNLTELRKNRRSPLTDWTKLNNRTVASVFMPTGGSPQEGRDCLHEEIAQALGPVNDLFRVPDTIFNDDNMHVVLTPYDMLLLRITYAPELRNGMSAGQVAAKLPAILKRLNPSGEGYAPRSAQGTDLEWKKFVFAALGSVSNDAARLRNINKAISFAQSQGYKDNRLGFMYFSRGHILAKSNPELAIGDFNRAYTIYSNAYGKDSIQASQAAIQLASFAFTNGNIARAESLIERALLTARAEEDPTLLFRLLGLKSAILKHQGKPAEAARVRTEAQGWAYYALGQKPIVTQIFDRIETLAPTESSRS